MELFFHSGNVLVKNLAAFLLAVLLPDGIQVFVQSQDHALTAILSTITSMPKVRETTVQGRKGEGREGIGGEGRG